MINDDALVELAKCCARTCHVLKDVTQGKDTNILSGSSRKAIEDLGRYVDPAHRSLSMMMSDIRTMRNIKSVVSERRNDIHDPQERHSGSANEFLVTQRKELRGILRILNVCDRQFSVHNF